MMSLRNGTVLAIVLSIAFVMVAVTMRDSLPGIASGNTSTAETVEDRSVQDQEPASMSGEGQIGRTPDSGIESSLTTSWDDESDDYEYATDSVDYYDDDDHDDHDGGYDDDDDDDDDE